jgi:DNA polymerase III epsilon subunit family exonuclease
LDIPWNVCSEAILSDLWQALLVPFNRPLDQLSFVSIDLETTGLVPGFDAITEIGGARFSLRSDGAVVPGKTFDELVNPERPISAKVFEITGINDEMVENARTIAQVIPDLLDYLEEEPHTVLLAHNARFDVGFLAAAIRSLKRTDTLPPAVCTVAMARRNLPDAPRYGLEALMSWIGADAIAPVESVHHRALPDALHARNLFAHCVQETGLMTLEALGAKRAVISDVAMEEVIDLPEHMAYLETAIDGGLDVDINYQGGSKGRSRRAVRPMTLFMQNGALYLRATCLVDLQDKSFRADRIRAVHPYEPLSEPLSEYSSEGED